MNLFDAIILGLVQGLTEFIPVSSSGHLVLIEHYLGLDPEKYLYFDVILHLGTILAAIIYFRKEIIEILRSLIGFVTGKTAKNDPYLKLSIFIVIATIPAAIGGVLFKDVLENYFRNIIYVAGSFIVLGIFFIVCETIFLRKKELKNIFQMKWSQALLIGFFQMIALIPGISRSGSTISAGLVQGFERKESGKFSFLLSIPIVLGAGLVSILKGPETSGDSVESIVMLCGFLSSVIFGFISIKFMMIFLKKFSLKIFSVYVIVLGMSILLFDKFN